MRPPPFTQFPSLSMLQADEISFLSILLAERKLYGPIAVCLVDAKNEVLISKRMDYCDIRYLEIAQQKAQLSLQLHTPTRSMPKSVNNDSNNNNNNYNTAELQRLRDRLEQIREQRRITTSTAAASQSSASLLESSVVAGGVLIRSRHNGAIVGAMGVAGCTTGELDEYCALAAIQKCSFHEAVATNPAASAIRENENNGEATTPGGEDTNKKEEEEEENRAATALQSILRGRKARVAVEERKKQERAAVALQSIARGHQARSTVDELKGLKQDELDLSNSAMEDEDDEDEDENEITKALNDSVSSVEKKYRSGRDKLKDMKEWRGAELSMQPEKFEEFVEVCETRNALKEKRAKKRQIENQAAVALQSVAHGHKARSAADQMKDVKKEGEEEDKEEEKEETKEFESGAIQQQNGTNKKKYRSGRDKLADMKEWRRAEFSMEPEAFEVFVEECEARL